MKKKSPPADSFSVLAGLSQEISAPLKSLLISSQNLLENYKSKDFEYVSYKDFKHLLSVLTQMNKKIKHCHDTVERLSGLSRSKIVKESCHINEVVKEIMGLLKEELADRKIKPVMRLSAGVSAVSLNRLDAHQVIHNVISNAIQAMPAGGSIKLRTTMDPAGKSVVVDIIDDGVGITPQHLSRVFEPFFTTKQHGIEKSSGLGLSIVQSIVKAAGGSVAIQSSLRKGTQVRIFLPASL